MEAKDTVMGKEQIKKALREKGYTGDGLEVGSLAQQALEVQAEISFKAGEQLALEKQGQAYLEGKQEGMKEVVEWGKEECVEHPTCETTVLLRRECDECWQAQKKKWEGRDVKVK